MTRPPVHTVHVFTDGPGGGNPAPIVLDASDMTAAEMQRVAQQHGHESGFVVPSDDDDVDFRLRFWMPSQEVSMCGHVTVGTVWLMHRLGLLRSRDLRIGTASGVVRARVSGDGEVEIAQPAGALERLDSSLAAEVVAALGLTAEDLAGLPIRNASTSRTKTLIPLASPDVLDALVPDPRRVAAVCALAESTGLYPWVVRDRGARLFEARQFPRSSGYPEDAATGVAAAALAYGSLADRLVDGLVNGPADAATAATDAPIRVQQGRAMGRPSEIRIRWREPRGVWLGGAVRA
ncbi:PhzF family phenazine biosynthesis protein [Leucobacter chromiiresistens]